MNIHSSHFHLLREAKRSGLTVEQVSPGVYSVPSRSNPGHVHTVKPEKAYCCCPAFEWCAHLALAYNEMMLESSERLDYLNAQREDFAQLELRILHGHAPAADRRYARPAAEVVRERLAERQEISF